MRQCYFDVGDTVRLKPIEEIVRIREFYCKFHGIVNPNANEVFFKEAEHHLGGAYKITDIEELHVGDIYYYRLELDTKTFDAFSDDWILFDEYFTLIKDIIVDDNINSMFGTMTYEVNSNDN